MIAFDGLPLGWYVIIKTVYDSNHSNAQHIQTRVDIHLFNNNDELIFAQKSLDTMELSYWDSGFWQFWFNTIGEIKGE